MYSDVLDLRDFYLNPLGQTVRRILRGRLEAIWPNIRGERILALGYGTPLLRPLLEGGGLSLAMMPAPQGVAYWPREGPNISSLVDIESLPLADNSVDRVILLHSFEGASHPPILLREVWRVMKGGGRLLIIVPNRHGLWAHSDHTPFGNGQPYSTQQLKAILRDQGFFVDRTWKALYLPPHSSRLMLSLADFLEKYGEILCPGLGGLHLMEAGKQLYLPLLTKTRQVQHRLVLPLPLPLPPGSLSAGRTPHLS